MKKIFKIRIEQMSSAPNAIPYGKNKEFYDSDFIKENELWRMQGFDEKLTHSIPEVLKDITLIHILGAKPLDILEAYSFLRGSVLVSEKAFNIIDKYKPHGYISFPVKVSYRKEILPYHCLYFEYDATKHLDFIKTKFSISTSLEGVNEVLDYESLIAFHKIKGHYFGMIPIEGEEKIYFKDEIEHEIFMFKRFHTRTTFVCENLKAELENKCKGFLFKEMS